MLKIYFAGSIRGGRDDRELYAQIIRFLQKYGKVLTEHIGLEDLGEDEKTDNDIWEQDMKWLDESDIIVADVTQPSIGVGYELGRAEMLGKPIISLYRKNAEKRVSAMISGNPSIPVYYYDTIEDVEMILDDRLKDMIKT